MAYSDSFPSVRPLWQLDASNGGRIPPNATFSRSDTPPTYAAPSAVHYWSNEKHLSSENLLADSNGFPAYATNNVVAPSASGTFIDGTDAFVVTETTANGYHFINSTSGQITSGTSYTSTVFVKAGTASSMQLAYNANVFGTGVYANYDLATPTNAPVTGADATATSTSLSDGWVKITLSGTATGSGSYPLLYVMCNNDDVNSVRFPTYTPASAKSFYIWEANVSTTGEKVLNQTSGQIHREYAPTLKSVSYAGQPRFEYSATDGESAGTSLGILLEGQAQNLTTYSENSLQWVVSGHLRTANAAIAPDGTLTATLMVSNSVLANRYFYAQNCTYASGTTYTGSVYVKAAGNNFCQLVFPSATFGLDAYANFTLTGAGAVSAGSAATGAIESVGNGFYRISITSTATASGTAATVIVTDIDSAADARFPATTGNDYDGVIVWGFQTEANSFASSYIKSNSGSATTRAADSLSMTDASLFDNGGGTLYAEARQNVNNTYNGIFSIDDGTGSNIAQMFGNTSNFRAEIASGGTTVANMNAAGNTVNTFHKHCLSFSPSEAKYYVNGSQIDSTDTDLNIPTMSQIHLGELNTSGNHLNGHIRRVAVYSEPLSATNAAAITS